MLAGAAAWDVAMLETKIAFCWFMDLSQLKLVLFEVKWRDKFRWISAFFEQRFVGFCLHVFMILTVLDVGTINCLLVMVATRILCIYIQIQQHFLLLRVTLACYINFVHVDPTIVD